LIYACLHTKFGDSRFSHTGDMIAGIETENGSCDPDHAHFRGGLSPESQDFIYSTSVQNLTILASAISEISLWAEIFKMGHVSLTTPLLG